VDENHQGEARQVLLSTGSPGNQQSNTQGNFIPFEVPGGDITSLTL
jgi:hypothetical protein